MKQAIQRGACDLISGVKEIPSKWNLYEEWNKFPQGTLYVGMEDTNNTKSIDCVSHLLDTLNSSNNQLGMIALLICGSFLALVGILFATGFALRKCKSSLDKKLPITNSECQPAVGEKNPLISKKSKMEKNPSYLTSENSDNSFNFQEKIQCKR